MSNQSSFMRNCAMAVCAVVLVMPVAAQAQGDMASPATATGAPHETMRQKFENLPPEKQAEIKQKREQRRVEMQKKLDAMTPEERAKAEQAMKDRREHRMQRREHMKEKWESMSPAEREQAKQHMMERREKFRDRWESMSPEQRAQAKEHMMQRRQNRKAIGSSVPRNEPVLPNKMQE